MFIAVIEDDPAFVLLYERTFLKDSDFKHFYSVSEFLKDDTVFDVAIVDLNVPGSYGMQTVKKVRTKHKNKLIVLTGAAGKFLRGKNMHAIIEAGADDVFKKTYVKDKSYTKMIRNEIFRT